MLVTDDALGVDQEGFRRAIDTQVQAQAALVVADIELIRIVELGQPLDCGRVVILVIDPVNDHALLGQLVQVWVLNLARRTPGGPDVDQRRLADQVGLGQGLAVLHRFQRKGRERLADHCRGQLGGVEEQTAVEKHRHQQKHRQRQHHDPTLHAVAPDMPSTSRTRALTLTR
ncbi:hypothetical protein D3C72_1762960 [compost metagenome]